MAEEKKTGRAGKRKDNCKTCRKKENNCKQSANQNKTATTEKLQKAERTEANHN